MVVQGLFEGLIKGLISLKDKYADWKSRQNDKRMEVAK